MKRRKKKVVPSLIDSKLLNTKVPDKIVTAEKVTEKLTKRKVLPKHKISTKYKAAISNYSKAVTRYKRAGTLLEKHHKALTKFIKKYN